MKKTAKCQAGAINFLEVERAGEAETGSDAEEMDPGSVKVEVADGFPCRCVFGFLHRFFEFLGKNIFFVGLLKPGVGEFVFALALLFFKDGGSLGEVYVRARFDGRGVRKNGAKDGVDDQLCLAARASYVEIFAVFESHAGIVRQRPKKEIRPRFRRRDKKKGAASAPFERGSFS